jgi:hypothetical protein
MQASATLYQTFADLVFCSLLRPSQNQAYRPVAIVSRVRFVCWWETGKFHGGIFGAHIAPAAHVQMAPAAHLQIARSAHVNDAPPAHVHNAGGLR